ncbi:MAG TPA: 50S ribosomal protein L23 [Anaerolineales bacterium]|jgi:large subunit ribosomal protein L23|nr:50S ribosomal protein L23 [Anaerolineales bacterium]
MKTNLYEVLRRPIITEKTNFQNSKLNQVVFEVASNATKPMIKEAVEVIFNVEVVQVKVSNAPAKKKMAGMSRRLVNRRKPFKKAVITLAPGDSIDIFEGVY